MTQLHFIPLHTATHTLARSVTRLCYRHHSEDLRTSTLEATR
ncbi:MULTISPECIES: hypothetical protein [Myxococcus]|nr:MULTISPECIES: hypothetical protein [Myxococcus]